MNDNVHLRRNPAAAGLISAISDDILIECLSRLPSSSLIAAAKVCRRWSVIIGSAAFAAVHGSLLHFTIFAITLPYAPIVAARLRIGLDDSWQKVLLPAQLISAVEPAHLISISRSIYILGHAATLLYDPLTGKITEKMAMLFRRKNFAAAVIGGRIYVAGGTTDTAAVEMYDPEGDSWRVIGAAPRRRCCCFGAGVGGVFHVIGGVKVEVSGSWKEEGGGGGDDLHYECSLDMYDVEGGAWLRSRSIPGGGCVVAACSGGGGVFVLMSHWVELSFWRFEGGGGEGEGEEEGWRRLRSPPVPTKISLGSRTRFSCVGNGREVALVQGMGYVDDLLVLKGRKRRGHQVGLVLLYDILRDVWSKAAELPTFSPRAVCAHGGASS